MTAQKFDEYAKTYDQLHNQSLSASGEPLEYFSAYKLACLKRLRAPQDGPILDYGCGIGNVTTPLAGWFREVHGYDPSPESLRVAREHAPGATFHDDAARVPDDHFATAVLSGVLHHVPKPERLGVLATVKKKLRPGGRLFVFEHNPLNPVTRHAVANCPFDDDAVLLPPWYARRLLREAAFANVRLRYIVFFPRLLALFRPLEPFLGWLPAGAQLMLTAER
jgi:SAM-dependent methyltransferase